MFVALLARAREENRKLTDIGVAADLGHINTNSVVTGHTPDGSGLQDALKGAEVVLIPAGVPRKPGMTRDGMTADSST